MKNVFILVTALMLLSTTAFCQTEEKKKPLTGYKSTAFQKTQDLVENASSYSRENMDKLMEAYVGYHDFTAEKKLAISHCIKFIADPYKFDVGYHTLDFKAIHFLNESITINRNIKNHIDADYYHLLLACDNSLPKLYNDFINNDMVLLSEDPMDCYVSAYNDEIDIAEEDEVWEEEEVGGELAEVHILKKRPINETGITSAIVDGAAQYLVDRVKAELLLAFFERFLDQVNKSTELSALLPNTLFLLQNNDIFNIPTMGDVWVTAFKNDLQNIPENLPLMILSDPKYINIKTKPEIQLFLIARDIFEMIDQYSEPMEILNALSKTYADTDLQVMNYIKVLDLISRNLLLDPDEPNLYIFDNNYRDLFSNHDEAGTYFSALLYIQDKSLFNTLSLTSPAGPSINFVDELQANGNRFAIKVGHFFTAIDQWYDSKDNIEEAESIFTLLDLAIEMIYFTKLDYFYQSSYYKIYKPIVKQIFSVREAADKKEYGQLIISTTKLIQPIANARIAHLEDVKKNQSKLWEQDKDSNEDELKILKGTVKNLLFYGGFMVDILSASESIEVKGIIQKYASPVGSYRVNRKSPFSISVSSHPGLYLGWESLAEKGEDASFVTGITAPIGLSFNAGITQSTLHGHSFSLYLPIVDIGAAFSYRWNSSKADGFPEDITLKQILSPGAHIVWGLGNRPLAFMVGAQYTPQLRKITAGTSDLASSAWRFGASFTMDLPIFHLYRNKGD